MDEFTRRLVPDGLWEITAPLISGSAKRAQGGGIARIDDRQVFAAMMFVLTTGCSWRHLPPTFGVSHQTAHRRFIEWSEAALWAKLHRAVLGRLGATPGPSNRSSKGSHASGRLAAPAAQAMRAPRPPVRRVPRPRCSNHLLQETRQPRQAPSGQSGI